MDFQFRGFLAPTAVRPRFCAGLRVYPIHGFFKVGTAVESRTLTVIFIERFDDRLQAVLIRDANYESPTLLMSMFESPEIIIEDCNRLLEVGAAGPE